MFNQNERFLFQLNKKLNTLKNIQKNLKLKFVKIGKLKGLASMETKLKLNNSKMYLTLFSAALLMVKKNYKQNSI